MTDELDLSQEWKWYYEERGKRVVSNLQKKNINAIFAVNKTEALASVLAMIPEGAKVVRGDSMSVDQVGVMEALKERNQNVIIDAFARDADGRTVLKGKERRQAQKEAFHADVFITGANAITLDGKIVSTDAVGNRVAPVIFGPEKVILVVGANKIVTDLDAALRRIHEVAAPLNAKRHALKHHRPEFGQLPCVITGVCVDCNSEWRICRYTTIIEGSMASEKGRINVVLVGEDLGI
ncbi:MAG: lactate utilization protein [Dehalococcoidia bacterium]|nr:lactate utilization protein [Dehalococcoidia bacterium]